jgi:hypothetical protein
VEDNKFLVRLILAISIFFTLGMEIYAGQPWSQKGIELIVWIGGFLGLGAFSILPYALLNHKIIKENYLAQSDIFLIGTLGICGLGVYALLDSFIFHKDAQGGLIMIFLPPLQLGLVGILIVVVTMLSKDKSV